MKIPFRSEIKSNCYENKRQVDPKISSRPFLSPNGKKHPVSQLILSATHLGVGGGESLLTSDLRPECAGDQGVAGGQHTGQHQHQ